MDLQKILKENQCTIVDVRTSGEFRSGHLTGAINIPLPELRNRIQDLRNLKGPLILCCASGNRSGQAHHFLNQQDIESIDGGSWLDLKCLQPETI